MEAHGSPAEEATAAIAAEIEKSLDENKISWPRLLLLAEWNTLDPAEEPQKSKEGKRLYLRARQIFEDQHGGAELAPFPSIKSGAYLLADGQLQIAVNETTVRFDTAKAWRLAFQIDSFAEEVKEWRAETPEDNSLGWLARARRRWSLFARIPAGHTAAALRPNSLRAYSLATAVLEAIRQENGNHKALKKGARRPAAGDEFKARLHDLGLELRSARLRFRQAAQRVAQGRYWRGTMSGALLLGLLSLFVGLLFWGFRVEAFYAVALPAGGLGAMVSVLQRMSAGKLVLNTDAGRDLIEGFGMVRPFIGAIFGMALTALFLGGIVPAVEVPEGQQLAFFAGLGFLAGFNERWAQDMLKSSSDQLKNPAPAETDPESPNPIGG
jgi:hypothetical protein